MKTLSTTLLLFLCTQFSYSQNGTVEATEGVIIGNNTGTQAGTIRWTGTDFEGYNGTTWKSLTNGSASLWTLNGNGDEIYYDAGKVAIGKTDPVKPLDVLGQTRIQSGADGTNYQLEVVENGFGRGGIQFRNSSNSVDYWALGAGLEANSQNKIGWYRNGDEKVVYHNSIPNVSTGGMKIGTGTPGEKLDVDGAIVIGNSANFNAGTIRWTGTDFEGYDGSDWLSLTASNVEAQIKVIPAHAINFPPFESGYITFINNYIFGVDNQRSGYLSLDFPEGTVIHEIRPMIYDASSTVRVEASVLRNTTSEGASSASTTGHGLLRTMTTNTFDYYDLLSIDLTIGPDQSVSVSFRPIEENGSFPMNWPSSLIRIVKIEIEYTLPQ